MCNIDNIRAPCNGPLQHFASFYNEGIGPSSAQSAAFRTPNSVTSMYYGNQRECENKMCVCVCMCVIRIILHLYYILYYIIFNDNSTDVIFISRSYTHTYIYINIINKLILQHT